MCFLIVLQGLDKAVKELLPHVEHRNCTRHIYANLKKKFPSAAVRNAFWEAAMATHPQAHKSAMKDLAKASKKAAERLEEFDPKVWSKAFFATHFKTDSTENNMSECFNSWILKTRFMPICDMLTEIHDLIMERMHQKRDAMVDVDCIILPKIKQILDANINESAECSGLWDGKQNFQVKWKETYMKTYEHGLEVLRGEPFWEEAEGDEILPPPMMKKLRGRPKKQRRREGWEGAVKKGKGKFNSMTRLGRVMHCTICRERGHNRGNCPNKPEGYVEQARQKRGGKRKVTTEDDLEVEHELERNEEEAMTGEWRKHLE